MTAQQIIAERLAKLEGIKLLHGSHKPDSEFCAMELVAWIAGEPWSDSPKCVSPILGAFVRRWNDDLDDEGRQKLKPFLPRLIGSAGDGKDALRGWLAADWLVRVHAPAWLELAGITESAAALRALAPLRGAASLDVARPSLEEAQKRSDAAGDAARAAAGEKLEPTKIALQASALELLDSMIDPKETE